jgi:drug/metabolite transporter (DMT)-like permease
MANVATLGRGLDALASPPRSQRRWLVPASLVALYLIWGSTYLGVRIALETLPPFLMAGVRYLAAGGSMYVALRLGGAEAPSPRQWRAAAITGIFLLTFGNGFIALGQRSVDSGVAAVVASTMPLWVAVLGSVIAFWKRRRGQTDAAASTSRGEWLGLCVGFLGAALLHLGGQFHGVPVGALVILLAPVSWAVGSILGRTLPLPNGAMATAAQMLAAGAAMIPIGLLLGERIPTAPSQRSLLALGYLTVFGSIVAFSAFGYLLRNVRPAVATSYAYINPLIALLLGAALAGERVPPSTWLSAVVVVAGVVIVSLSRGARASAARQ